MDQTERELREMLADRRLVNWPTEAQWKAIWLAANAEGYKGTVSAVVHDVDPALLDVDWIDMMNVAPADAKMMWAEICVRRSVSPFVEVNTPFTDTQKAEAAFQQQLQELTDRGWTIISNGPEGPELRAPKTMKLLDKVLLGLGVLTLIVYGLGLLFIAIAIVDYRWFTTPATLKIARPASLQPA